MTIISALFLHSLLLISGIPFTSAQQPYIEQDGNGYSCVQSTPQCQAYATYRAVAEDNIVSVGLRFGLSAEQIAVSSQISSASALTAGQLLIVPLNCSCVTGRYQYNVTYVIQSQDTFYIVSNQTFQGLTTFQAVERSNPTYEPTNLQAGDQITFPIRCACPSVQQAASGAKSLLTYVVWPTDSIQKIASDWNVSTEAITSGNTPTDGGALTDLILQAFTTLLLPVTKDGPPSLPQQSSPPPANNTPSPPPVTGSPPDSSSSNTGRYVGIAVGCVAAVALLGLGAFFYRKKKKKSSSGNVYNVPSKNQPSSMASSYTATERDQFSASMKSQPQNDLLLAEMNDLVDSDKPMVFTYEELQDATNNFSPSSLIQGSVYRGILRKRMVAIKEMKGGTTSHELKILCKVHHSNLVRLVGVCSGADNLFLVYEYADNGSLSSCLHNKTPDDFKLEEKNLGSASTSSAFLSWNTRVQIALDVATGLEYIHDYTKPSFVHKDVKSSNILLDGNFRAKIANFGMARLTSDTALTKHIAGTQGYMSPEYLAHGFITTKVDVYAFGVVLLELLTGREAILSDSSNPERRYLAEAFSMFFDEVSKAGKEEKIEKLQAWLDPVLENAVPWDTVLSFVQLARTCVDTDPDARPSMKDITYKLSKLLDACLEWETTAALNRKYRSTTLEGR